MYLQPLQSNVKYDQSLKSTIFLFNPASQRNGWGSPVMTYIYFGAAPLSRHQSSIVTISITLLPQHDSLNYTVLFNKISFLLPRATASIRKVKPKV